MKVGDITIKTIFLNDLSIVSFYLSIAFIGHFLTHLPLSMQRLKSITVKPSESCGIAPTGHALISGQIWS